eukprot:TRINITY_DN27443_c0_g1_i3.p2 TRINITY_DN27443_c0_g1~~TRINITY_DN27443_c0_g1_i3.p2  ORF type:complete len:141 (+),score=51.27 TRINITY_DN27443_c0_g1_i3:57-479(+)
MCMVFLFFFFFKQKTAYEMLRSLVGSEMCIRDRYGVWPQLLMLSNGWLVLASGRPGIGFWVSPAGDGSSWIGYDVEAEHSARLPSDPWDVKHGTGSTEYTGIAEVEPGIVLLAYDKTSGAGRAGALQKVYSVRIQVDASA